MKLKLILTLLMLATLGMSTSVQAGPNCDVRPNHPNCEPSTGDPGPVYFVEFTDFVEFTKIHTGTDLEPGIYTTPGTLDGDETGLNANPNGPNEVRFGLHDFLTTALGKEDFEICFPDERLSGSIQLQDNSVSSGDPDRVGYIWVHAFDASGNDMQYAIDLFNAEGQWEVALLPGREQVSERMVTEWRLRRTKKKNVNECVSEGFVSGPSFTIRVVEAEFNPWYGDP